MVVCLKSCTAAAGGSLCMDIDFSMKFVLEDDDSDTEKSPPQPTLSQRTPQLPVAPSFRACSKPNASLQLLPMRQSFNQTMESHVDLAGSNNTLPGNAMISAFNQILSTNPSGKQPFL